MSKIEAIIALNARNRIPIGNPEENEKVLFIFRNNTKCYTKKVHIFLISHP